VKILVAAMPRDRRECLALDENAADLGYSARPTPLEYSAGVDRSAGSENPCILLGSYRPSASRKHLPEVPETGFSKPLARTVSRRHRRLVSRCYRGHGSGTNRTVHRRCLSKLLERPLCRWISSNVEVNDLARFIFMTMNTYRERNDFAQEIGRKLSVGGSRYAGWCGAGIRHCAIAHRHVHLSHSACLRCIAF